MRNCYGSHYLSSQNQSTLSGRGSNSILRLVDAEPLNETEHRLSMPRKEIRRLHWVASYERAPSKKSGNRFQSTCPMNWLWWSRTNIGRDLEMKFKRLEISEGQVGMP